MKVDVWHNIMWSKYKASVLSELHTLALSKQVDLRVFQIAETEAERQGLSGVDRSAHRYPYELLFQGAYSDVPLLRRIRATAARVLRSTADVTIIAGYHRPEYILQILLVRLSGRKVAAFCDSTISDHRQTLLKGLLKRCIFGLCDAIFCYGERSAAYLRYYGVPERKVIRRCQAAAVDDGLSSPQRLQRRRELRATLTHGRFLFVGRLSPEKGLDTLIAAFAEIAARCPHFELRIVGSGAQRDELQTQINGTGYRNRIHLLGPLSGDPLWDEYAAASALVLASRSEPWGLVVNEALSYGCPVIVSEACGCVPELVIAGITGEAFATDDRIGLAEAMLQVVEADRLDDHQAAATRQSVINQFTPQSAARSILSGCFTMLGRGRPTWR